MGSCTIWTSSKLPPGTERVSVNARTGEVNIAFRADGVRELAQLNEAPPPA
jgi:hypothetical protein